MRAIGRAANFIVGIVETIFSGAGKIVIFVINVVSFLFLIKCFWSLIDGAHFGTFETIAGIVGLTITILVALLVIGEALDPAEFKNFFETREGATTATRDELIKAGLIKKKR